MKPNKEIVIGIDIFAYMRFDKEVSQSLDEDTRVLQILNECLKGDYCDVKIFPTVKSFFKALNNDKVDTENMNYFQVSCPQEYWDNITKKTNMGKNIEYDLNYIVCAIGEVYNGDKNDILAVNKFIEEYLPKAEKEISRRVLEQMHHDYLPHHSISNEDNEVFNDLTQEYVKELGRTIEENDEFQISMLDDIIGF